MIITFNKLPQSMDEFMSTPYSKLERPEYAAALFIVAMTIYPKDRELCYQMVEYLKGPSGLSPYERQFLRDRMMDADYLPFSFMLGSSPQNNYTPSIPYSIEITENPYSHTQEGYAKLFIKSSGADSVRSAVMRLKPSTGQWFLNEQFLLSGIKIPVSNDPWA